MNPFVHSLITTWKRVCWNRKSLQMRGECCNNVIFRNKISLGTKRFGSRHSSPIQLTVVIVMTTLVLTVFEKLKHFWINSYATFLIIPFTARTWRRVIFNTSLTWRSGHFDDDGELQNVVKCWFCKGCYDKCLNYLFMQFFIYSQKEVTFRTRFVVMH